MNVNSEGLSVVIPALNERHAIVGLIDSLQSVLRKHTRAFEIIVIDDGSTDGMSDVLQDVPGIQVLHHPTPQGYGRSLSDGIQAARYPNIAILDADGTYRPEELPELLSAYQNHDMVVGWRKKIHLPNAKLPKSFARSMLHRLAWALTGVHIQDLNSGYRVFKKDFWEAFRAEFPTGFSFTTTLTLLAIFSGRRLKYVPIEYRPRIGQTKVHYFFDGLKVANWMLRLTIRHHPQRLLLPLLMLVALAMRLPGLGFGLPGTFFADEPHHINIAVYFGSGDLNPHVFKYPTLWMYVLSALYGLIFVFWSGFGFLRNAADYSYLFIWEPTLFYYSARLLGAMLVSLSLFWIYRGAMYLHGSVPAALFSCLLIAVCPPLIYFGHQAKPDMLMFFLVSSAWCFSLRFLRSADPRSLLVAGLALGLAGSTQYTAILMAPLLPIVYFARRTQAPASALGGAVVMAVIFFLIGTPFAVLDFSTFVKDVRDVLSYGGGGLAATNQKLGTGSLFHFSRLAGPWIVGAILLLMGSLVLIRRNRAGFYAVALALALGAVVLGMQNRQAGVINYAFPLYPGIALVMGAALHIAAAWRGRLLILLAVLLATPAALTALRSNQDFAVVDTRAAATKWIEAHVPEGATVLVDQIFASPALKPTWAQVESLRARTTESGHARGLYFKRMMESHPGGGYRLLRIHRTPEELVSMRRHTEWSQQGYDLLDVESGLEAVREANVQFVVLTSFGATKPNSPRLRAFFEDLEKMTPVQTFEPESPHSPRIVIYEVPTPATPPPSRTSSGGSSPRGPR